MKTGFSRQNSSPSHNSLSLNPSPVPSLELIPLNNQMETLVSAIPDTCPNIKVKLKLLYHLHSKSSFNTTKMITYHFWIKDLTFKLDIHIGSTCIEDSES